MRYVIMAVAGVLALVGWLNTSSGTHVKHRLIDANSARYLPVE